MLVYSTVNYCNERRWVRFVGEAQMILAVQLFNTWRENSVCRSWYVRSTGTVCKEGVHVCFQAWQLVCAGVIWGETVFAFISWMLSCRCCAETAADCPGLLVTFSKSSELQHSYSNNHFRGLSLSSLWVYFRKLAAKPHKYYLWKLMSALLLYNLSSDNSLATLLGKKHRIPAGPLYLWVLGEARKHPL